MPPMPLRVLFVSKPIAAPFFDGTKCVVRDLSTHLTRYEAVVMGTRGPVSAELEARPSGPPVHVAPVYATAGSYAPTLADNARAAAWLVLRSRADLWHFVFAPNPRTTAVGRLARAVRRVPVLQTIASPPARFSSGVFFGDVVVAQSAFTSAKVSAAFRDARKRPPRLEVIPPPIGPLRLRTDDELAAVRRALDLPRGGPVFTYPGDLEVSRGADTVARAVALIVRELPDAIVVFACRRKTPDAPRIEAELQAQLDPRHVRFAREIDLPALFGATDVVLFPVDDLHGKVDLPIAVLEAMRLGVPVVAVDAGPLAELEGVEHIRVGDAAALARTATRLVRDSNHRAELVAKGQAEIVRRYEAGVVARAYERLYDELLKTHRSRAPTL